jgi:serine phosphatase RsbU (regulator of sigma subunit)
VERIVAAAQSAASNADIQSSIRDTLRKFRAGAAPNDDTTMVVVQI